ncbi:uncharacterized protein M421DRAFT_419578 [Didymella exigua CBS 183.55]|uniref:Eisosome protein 1 n=1 Tax=Didymella exigua CBS 183.55 TaxID=1150837 RepID=A0A6A5RU03_9PLEO|nr:uncharacterized protein M421DRAFT_419578 [Didymella exigua CBS 183.55]KAF1929796.1 hypothetical protein M421DRAFT_419578 [Didymella exigua CBS 183.55]
MATTGLSTAVPHMDDGAPLKSTQDAPPNTSTDKGMRCPDPSAHLHQSQNNALQNQASAAALYSTRPASEKQKINPLGPDGKLSSASAAASLKYAKANDLPSFPVIGIDTSSSAGTAALLAHQNKKSPEWWKPEQSSAAGKAALLANDYKMKPLWQPEASAAGSRAALLAHRDGGKLNLWQPEASAEGNSAANIAMRKTGLGPQIDYGYTEDGRNKALIAATGATSASNRKRAQSIPSSVSLYPDQKNSAKNALSAATIAHSPSMRASKVPAVQPQDSSRLGSGAMEAARIQHAKSSREMYTSAPPVSLEIEEKKRNDALRASAVVMAQKMYSVQQQHIDGPSGVSAARTGATTAHGQQRVATSEGDLKSQAMQYIGIQEAAQKLAQERLAKIGYDENAAYRSYYGYEKQNRSKLSMRRGRPRARSTSEALKDDSDSDEDDFRSRRIRHQMKEFNQQLADVDAKKREQDRKGLIAAAERKVKAQMLGLDKDIFDKTGKMPTSVADDWDEKARQRALANSEARMENHGRVNIGNGKWMDQAEIEAIAQARLQPTLDEISEKAEKQRALDAERQLELENKKRQEQEEKARQAEIKAEEKRGRDEEKRAAKARNAEDKAAAKQAKEAEKTKKVEEQRLAREEHRKSKEAERVVPAAGPALGTSVVATPTGPIAATATDGNADLYKDPTAPTRITTETTVPARDSTAIAPTRDSAATALPSTDPASPTSPTSSKGFKSIFNKLKRRSKHDSAVTESDGKTAEKDTGFVGGATLRASQSNAHSSTTPSTSHAEVSSVTHPTDLGDVEPTVIAGPAVVPHVRDDRHSGISSLSSDDEELSRGRPRPQRLMSNDTRASSDFEEARDHFDEDLAPPPTFTSEVDKGRHGSPVRDSKFHEVGI